MMAEFERRKNGIQTLSVRKKSAQTRSEGRLQTKKTEGTAKKPPMTGFEPLKGKQGASEVLRLENSYGNIAFGGNERRELTIMVSEKRRHNSRTIDREKKQLRESREVVRPLRSNRIAMRNDGATAFRFQRDATKNVVLSTLRTHFAQGGGATTRQVLPFLESQGHQALSEERDRKKQNENAFNLRMDEALRRIRTEAPKEAEKRRSSIAQRRTVSAAPAAQQDDGTEEGGLPEQEGQAER